MIITVCVGSSCHIKGARDVIMSFDKLIKEKNLNEQIELKGSFCMEKCGSGINWQIDEQFLTSQSPEEAIEIFRQKVIKELVNNEN